MSNYDDYDDDDFDYEEGYEQGRYGKGNHRDSLDYDRLSYDDGYKDGIRDRKGGDSGCCIILCAGISAIAGVILLVSEII